MKAVSVNPVDTKVRKRAEPQAGGAAVLGFDAAGVVEAVGPDVTLFKAGRRGLLRRRDHRGPAPMPNSTWSTSASSARKPKSLDFAEAAALPLTAITAWEMLFDRLDIAPATAATRQVAADRRRRRRRRLDRDPARAQLTGLTVIATASRPETPAGARSSARIMSSTTTKPLAAQITALGSARRLHLLVDQHRAAFRRDRRVIAPQGRFGLIDDPEPLDVAKLKRKSVSMHWELMFTRSMFQTADMVEQHELLNEVAAPGRRGHARTTVARLGTINAANLRRAHALIESGRTIGKIVLEGF